MSQKSISVIIEIIHGSSKDYRLITLPEKICNSLKEPFAKLKVGMAEETIRYESNDRISYDCFMDNTTEEYIECEFNTTENTSEEYIKCESNITDNTVEISSNIAKELGLSQGMITNLVIKDNNVCLGPVMGVFVNKFAIKKLIKQVPSFRYTELWRANRDSNLIPYFFSIDDVDFINQRINGTYYNEEKQVWSQKAFPLPEILYDRGGGFLKKQRAMSKYIRRQLNLNKNLKKLNATHYFDKWEVYKHLIQHEDMKPYIPFTALYREPYNLIEIFDKSSTIYIKGCCGSNGREVVRVIKSGDKSYHLSYFHGTLVEYKLKSLEELVDKIETIFGKKKIILQSAIDVIELDGRNIDMRATVQRDGSGELGVYSHPVRLGQKRSPITSTKSGSRVYMFDDFFIKHYNYTEKQVTDLKTKVNKMLMKSYLYIEEAYGSYGELGIDFAIDKKGNIWFIECNAKPGKDSMYLSYDKDTIKKAFQNPLEYAKYICGF